MGNKRPFSKTERDTDWLDRIIGGHHWKTTIRDDRERVVKTGFTPRQAERRASDAWRRRSRN